MGIDGVYDLYDLGPGLIPTKIHRALQRKPLRWFTCEVCAVPFTSGRQQTRARKRRFCSPQCTDAARRLPTWGRPDIERFGVPRQSPP
jgi:hypothetical protein